MNTIKAALLCAVGLTIGSVALTASAADMSAKTAPSAGMMGNSQHMLAAHDSCKHEHAMMGGYDHGMMGGMGMMGGSMMMESPRADMVRRLSLNDEQRARINKLSDKLHHDNWAAMGLIMDESNKLRDLYETDRRDPDAIARVYKKIFDTKIQMIRAMVTTENQIEDLLTKDQRAQLKSMRQQMSFMMHGHSMMY